MAGTILVKDVLYRVSAQLTDAPDDAGQFKRWSERELVAWYNDGQRVIAKYLPSSCSRIDAIKLAPGTRQSIELVASASIKPGDGSAAVDTRGKILLDVVRNMGADGATPGSTIGVVSRDVLDSADPGWHSETGSAVSDYVYDARIPKYFYVSPGAPATGAVWVEIAWLVNPIDAPYVAGTLGMDGTSTATISIDDQFVDDLVSYILARANMKEAEVAANAQLAAGYTNLFTSSINAQSLALTGVNPNLKMLPMTPSIPAAAN